jgi:hypothetical protein
MRYEVGQRVETDASRGDVLNHALLQFKKISRSVKKLTEDEFVAKSIEATFGSANRADKTIISARPIEGGWYLVADVNYRPSLFFWIILIVLLFTWIGWIFPLIFYFTQKTAVKNAIEAALNRTSGELSRSVSRGSAIAAAPVSALDELEKLASLKERGFITEEEFSAKKASLLR